MSEERERSTAESLEIERAKMKMGLVKFILGTFLVGLISIAVSCSLKQQELQILALEKENKQLEMFMNLSLRAPEERRAFALYFATLARDEQLRKAWSEYGAAAEREIQEAAARRQEQVRGAKTAAREIANLISMDLRSRDSNLREALAPVLKSEESEGAQASDDRAKQLEVVAGAVANLIRTDLERDDSKLRELWDRFTVEPATEGQSGAKVPPP